MTRDEALAICFANLKGPKDKDFLRTAEALSYLRSLPEYSSNAKVGQAVGVSGEIVREFLTLLRLPPDIQHLFERRQLRLEHGRRLWQLSRRRPELLFRVVEAMKDLNAIDSRHLVEYIFRHPETSVEDAKSAVLDGKTVKRHEYHVIAILPEAEYRALAAHARRRNTATNDLVTQIVLEWLESDGGNV